MKNKLHIYFIKQEEKLVDEIFQQFLLQMPVLFKNEIVKYTFWQGAQSSLLGKIILQFGFKQLKLNHTLADIKITTKDRPYINVEKLAQSPLQETLLGSTMHKPNEKDEKSKRYQQSLSKRTLRQQALSAESLEDDSASTNIDFNISHSGSYIICVIAENAKVGIDIEKHRTLKTNIADRYFDENECHEMDKSEDSIIAFFDLWSLKESAIKCDGRGVEVLSKTHKQYQTENKIKCDEVVFHYQSLNIAEKYSCCVCADKNFDIEIQELKLKDLLT